MREIVNEKVSTIFQFACLSLKRKTTNDAAFPKPECILVAKIQELEDAVHQCVAILISMTACAQEIEQDTFGLYGHCRYNHFRIKR